MKFLPVFIILMHYTALSQPPCAESFENEQDKMSYGDARAFVRSSFKLSRVEDFLDILVHERELFPENFPSNPRAFYSERGEWAGYEDFLGMEENKGERRGIMLSQLASYKRALYEERMLSERNLEDSDWYENESNITGQIVSGSMRVDTGAIDQNYKRVRKESVSQGEDVSASIEDKTESLSQNEDANASTEDRAVNLNVPSEEQITSASSYREHYPHVFYREEWKKIGGWPEFFGSSRPSFIELQQAVREYNLNVPSEEQITSASSYREHYPHVFYREEWKKIGGWPEFFGSSRPSFIELQQAVREYNLNVPSEEQITSASSYREHYRNIPGAPSHPDRFYRQSRNEDQSFMSFNQARAYIQRMGISSHRDFVRWSRSGNKPENFPAIPDVVYEKEWRGWRHFFGKSPSWRRSGILSEGMIQR